MTFSMGGVFARKPGGFSKDGDTNPGRWDTNT